MGLLDLIYDRHRQRLLLCPALRLLVLAGIAQGNRQLVSNRPQKLGILLAQAVGDVMLHIQGAQHRIAQQDGHRQLAACFGQQRVGQPVEVLAGIRSQDHVSGEAGLPHQALAYGQTVALLQHGLTGFAGAAHHDQFSLRFVHQVNMDVIVVEGKLQQVHHFAHQLRLVEDGRKTPADIGAQLQRPGAVGNALLQAGEGFLQLGGHRIEGLCQRANFIPAMGFCARRQIAGGHASGHMGQAHDGRRQHLGHKQAGQRHQQDAEQRQHRGAADVGVHRLAHRRYRHAGQHQPGRQRDPPGGGIGLLVQRLR